METNFVCCICHQIPSNVVESACCNSLFCWDCVVGKPKPCPSCHKTLDPSTCTENLAVKKIVEGLEVKCSMAGCNEKFSVSERGLHEATCTKRPSLCPNSDLCGIIDRGSMSQHLLSCQFRRIECHMCEITLPLPQLQEHLDTVCPEVAAECQLCRAKIVRKNISSHIDVACPSVETECPFAPYGCAERPFRSQAENHINENFAHHLQLVANAFQTQQNQINALTEQLAMTQNVAADLSPETGVIYQFDRVLTRRVNAFRNSGAGHYLRNRVTPRLIAGMFLFLLALKLLLCFVFRHRGFFFGIVRFIAAIVQELIMLAVVVKVSQKVVTRASRGAAWTHDPRWLLTLALGYVFLRLCFI